MEKVELTKAQVERLDGLLQMFTKSSLVRNFIEETWLTHEALEDFKDVSDDEIIRAVYFGYTVKKSVGDKLADLYNEARQSYLDAPAGVRVEGYWQGKAQGIQEAGAIAGYEVKVGRKR